MIKVENLTKRYAGQPAIQDLNFEVGRGEIMGFLGRTVPAKPPRCAFWPASCRPPLVAPPSPGFDVFEQSLQARAHLGYMPENVPLYSDMRVTEYLDYRAALKESNTAGVSGACRRCKGTLRSQGGGEAS